MKCPYCLSDIDSEAYVCKVCTKDLYLFKPLIQKVSDLEEKLSNVSDREVLESRISELQEEFIYKKELEAEGIVGILLKISKFLFLPLLILLMAHAVIIVVYDLKLIYLRLASILIPMPFAFFLFQKKKNPVFPWFLGSLVLAFITVIGMSAITSLVDKTPVMPQSMIEWKEFIEYSLSITFSFLTGILLGTISFFKRSKHKIDINPMLKALLNLIVNKKLSPEALQELLQKSIKYVSLATTLLSLYTGLRRFFE
ncbi:MAG: hypothetical protein EB137_04855 [Actinobacteria bacterium]|nr:hypothetical protein [Actinomycetota bacterium]